MVKDGKPTKITTLKDFLEFKGRTDLWNKIVSKTSNKNTETAKSGSRTPLKTKKK